MEDLVSPEVKKIINFLIAEFILILLRRNKMITNNHFPMV